METMSEAKSIVGPLPKSLSRYRKLITAVSDERGSGDGYWVYLIAGWQNAMDLGCHIVHEETASECAAVLSDVIPCDCADCERYIL
jgi:hypothetical protein